MIFLFILIPLVSGIHVRTYVSSMGCPGCVKWVSMIEQVRFDFPTLTFETVVFDYESASQNTVLPYTTAADSYYPWPQRSEYLVRWLSDISHGRPPVLVQNISSVGDGWRRGFVSWVHVLSEDYPRLDSHARKLLSTGFGWSFMNSSFFNTVIFQRVDGEIGMEHNVNDMNVVLRRLVPSPIPFALTETACVRELLHYFDSDVYLVSPQVPSNLPENVAWIHLFGNESDAKQSNMSVPSAWMWKRDIEYMLPSVSRPELLEWYFGVKESMVEPYYRPSHAIVGDISGNELWSWVRGHPSALLIVYNSLESLYECQEELSSVEFEVGRMDIRVNDHESFPDSNVPGMVHYYSGGNRVSSAMCKDIMKYISIN